MSASEYGETWNPINDEPVIERVKKAIHESSNENNQFEAYDFYTVQDTFNPHSFHYVIRLYAGCNGCGEWSSYLTDMTNIFKALIDKNKGNFKSAWLIEWRNNCASDTSAALIGLRD